MVVVCLIIDTATLFFPCEQFRFGELVEFFTYCVGGNIELFGKLPEIGLLIMGISLV
jgi:hypothetical protein